ncbi:MAG: sensor histidine kinase [Chitinophagaceae bacterium]|nr:sensor histidine kinase [Chitinophagaceae bacterium]
MQENKLVFSNRGQPSPLNTDKLFKRFSKSNPSKQGTGLGLSIVKKIADINNWTVAYNYENNLHSFFHSILKFNLSSKSCCSFALSFLIH